MNRIHVVPVLLSCILLVVVWQLGAFLVGSPLIIPYPLDVLSDALALAGGSDFPVMLGTTIIRGLAAFFISVALSFLVGIPAGMSVGFETAIRPWMAVIRATPVVSLILIALFWFGSSFVPVFVSVLMTMPVMTESIMRGIRSTDSDLLAMSRIYRFGTLKRLRYIRVPSMLPYFFSGAGSSLGLTWKVVIAGEIIAFPHHGIGTAMQTAKVHLETGRVFSLTLVAILLCLLTEKLFALVTKNTSIRISGGTPS